MQCDCVLAGVGEVWTKKAVARSYVTFGKQVEKHFQSLVLEKRG